MYFRYDSGSTTLRGPRCPTRPCLNLSSRWVGTAALLGMSVFEIERKTRAADESGVRARSYSPAQILVAIREWTATYGEPPRWLDWDPAAARRKGAGWRADRFVAGDWPSMRVVCRAFPTLTDAVRAAGLTPRRPGSRKANIAGPDAVLDAIREWTRRFGDPPRQTDLDPFRARRTNQPWRIERYEEGDWPSLNTVRHHFGTLAGAIVAAGLEAVPLTETLEDRVERRRRNRLALVEYGSRGARGGPSSVADAVRAVSEARARKDVNDLEAALLRLAAEAIRWAERLRPGLPAAAATSQRSRASEPGLTTGRHDLNPSGDRHPAPGAPRT